VEGIVGSDMGVRTLKGMSAPVQIYAILV